MRVALLAPTYWPEVRRGSERVVHDLSGLLARRGHEVTVLTTHAAPTAERFEDGVRIIRRRRPPRVPRLRWYEDHIETTASLAARLLAGRFDVAQAFHNADAWAAVKARRLGGPPVVYSFHGLPTREYLVDRRYRIEIMRAAISGAAETTVLSDAAAQAMRRYLQCDPVVLPAGVFTERFASAQPPPERPILLCAASIGDPRKRGELLLAAFARLRRRLPDARLQLVRTVDPVLSSAEPRLPVGAAWAESPPGRDPAPVYAGARASVLAAVGEAFGLVVIESLAAGRPVAAARSGASPEILDNEGIGVLVEPDDRDALVDGLERVLELGAAPETAVRCRARAADYHWSARFEAHERVLESAAAN